MKRKKVVKKLLCMILAVVFAVNTIYSEGGLVFAAESEENREEDAGNLTVSPGLQENVTGARVQDELGTEDVDEGINIAQDLPGAERQDVLDAEQNTPEQAPDAEEGAGSEDLPGEEGSTGGQDFEQAEMENQQRAELEQAESRQQVQSERAGIPADHSLATVYWNTNPNNEIGSGGLIQLYGGSDANSGADKTMPVQTFEAALQRAATNAVIYCMNYDGMDENDEVNGSYYGVTIKRFTNYNGNIFQISNGRLTLSNLTLDGSDDYNARVLTIANNGELVIGDSLKVTGSSSFFLEARGKALCLKGQPERDTMYYLNFDPGFATDSGQDEVMLVDASPAGINPEPFFTVGAIPTGWETFVKNGNQLWLRKIQPYTAIWLDGVSGNDSNSGRTAGEAVKTYEKAYELYQNKLGGNGNIYVIGKVKVEDSLSIDQVHITRGNNGSLYTGVLFEVTERGSLTIGQAVVMDQESPYFQYTSLKSSGDLSMDADASIRQKIYLVSPDHPLEITGTNSLNKEMGIVPGDAYQDGDLIVRNGVGCEITLRDTEFVLEERGRDLYLKEPVRIFLNGLNGNDSRDGFSKETAVKTLQRALEIATAPDSVCPMIYVLEAPAVVHIGSDETLVIPSGIEVTNYNKRQDYVYLGDVLQIESGTLQIDGEVSGDVRIQDEGKIRLTDAQGEVSGNIYARNHAEITLTDGTISGSTLLADSGTSLIQGGGTVSGKVDIYSGSFLLSGGKVIQSGIVLEESGNGSFHMTGGYVGNCFQSVICVDVNSGTFVMEGGKIADCSKGLRIAGGIAEMKNGEITNTGGYAINVEPGGQMYLEGGRIYENGGDDTADVSVKGDLHIVGNISVEDVILLEKGEHPLLLETSLATDTKFSLEFSNEFLDPAHNIAVKGSDATPAVVDNFLLTESMATFITLGNAGNNVEITVAYDTEAIYLSGSGNDNSMGLTPTTPVRTLERAKERLLDEYRNNGKELNIYLVNSIDLMGVREEYVVEFEPEQFPWQPRIIRFPGYKGIMFYAWGKVTFQNVIIDGNEIVSRSSSILYQQDNNYGPDNEFKITIRNGAEFTGNQSTAVNMGKNGKLVMEGGRIYNNYSWGYLVGGAIETGTEGCSVEINGGMIDHNKAESGGGAIMVTNGNFIMTGGEISNNTAKYGGGIGVTRLNRDDSFRITGGKISNNHAEYGGGLYFSSYDNTTEGFMGHVIDGGEISGNTADYGGGIFCNSETFNIFHVLSNVTINGGEIKGNQAAINGGGICMQHCNLFLRGGILTGNSAQRGGGIARETSDSKTSLYGGQIVDNQAEFGAGMYVGAGYDSGQAYAKLAADDCVVNQNISLGSSKVWVDWKTTALKLTEALDPNSHYYLEVEDSPYAVNGMPVVIPDGAAVTDAAQYLKNFSMNDHSGFHLVKSGNNIVLGQAYYVDGVNGSDSNNGFSPDTAFKTMTHAIQALGTRAGAVFICGTIMIADAQTWQLQDNQTIYRYTGEAVSAQAYTAFTGNLIEIAPEGSLTLKHVLMYDAMSREDDTSQNGYMAVQGGTLRISADSALYYGTVYLKDTKEIEVTGDATAMLMKVEKENPMPGDVIGRYVESGVGHADTADFSLTPSMEEFSLARDGDTVILDTGIIYVDGQNGNDTNDGHAPDRAFLTMKRAYEALQASGGLVYVVDTVEYSSSVTLGAYGYQDDRDNIAVGSGRVSVLRYEQNINPLFTVNQNTLTIKGLKIDGGSAVTVRPDNQSPLIRVEQTGVLEITDQATLKNNCSAGVGGAIYNEGTVNLHEGTLIGNQAEKGAGIYQGGVLSIQETSAELADQEIYFARDKFINIGASLEDGASFKINMDPADTVAGRKIAVFENGTYHTWGVIREAEHFHIDPSATTKGMAAEGEQTLVLEEDFGVRLSGGEFFEKIGNTVSVNAWITSGIPSDVTLTVSKDGTPIQTTVTDYNRYKRISIPVSLDSIGTLSLTFTYRDAVVPCEVIISGYQVEYEPGQESLIAEAQDDGRMDIHKDQAKVTVHNGAGSPRNFSAEHHAIGYSDRAAVQIDNGRVAKDLEPEDAMKIYGFEVQGLGEISPHGSITVNAVLSNADALTEEKTGTITLVNASLGVCSANIDLAYQTRVMNRAKIRVRLDGELLRSLNLVLKNASGQEFEMVNQSLNPELMMQEVMDGIYLRDSQNELEEEWTYQLTGLMAGTYQIWINSRSTGLTIQVPDAGETEKEINIYSIQYTLNGGVTQGVMPSYYIQGIGTNQLENPLKEGNTFLGWFTNEEMTQGPVGSISGADSGRFHLYAKWQEQEQETFDVSIDKTEYFDRVGNHVSVRAEILNGNPGNISVIVKKDEQTIPSGCATEGQYQDISIQVGPGSIGSLTLVFTDGTNTVTKEIVVSGYEVVYRNGQESLIAQAQTDGRTEIHQDTAQVMVYNGASQEREFHIGNMTMAYDDGAEAVIDNAMISRDMDEPMKYFGVDVSGTGRVPAEGSLSITVVLSNGDKLTDHKTGDITLGHSTLGENSVDIAIDFQTIPFTRVQIKVTRDGQIVDNAEVQLHAGSGEALDMVNLSVASHRQAVRGIRAGRAAVMVDQQETDQQETDQQGEQDGWIYQLTGLLPNHYSIYLNGMDVNHTVDVQAGVLAREEIRIYSIHYELNGAPEQELTPDFYIQGIGVSTLPRPNRDGYLFGGWYTDESMESEEINSINPAAEGIYNLYAKWEKVPVQVPDEPKPSEPQIPEQPMQQETPVQQEPPVIQADKQPVKSTGPKTGDSSIIAIDIALIGGMSYLMRMFAVSGEAGMSEEEKERILRKIIRKARGKNGLVRIGAAAVVFFVLLFYYTVGMKEEVRMLKKYQRAC